MEGEPSANTKLYIATVLLLTCMVVCTKCGYEWEYSGSMAMATCPSCLNKTPANEESDL